MQAKQDGGNRTVFYGHGLQAKIRQRLALEHDLQLALNTDQLQMALQPQYASDDQVTGAEVLMRWTHPEQGPISPAVFIPIAEETGLINHLTDESIREACVILNALAPLGATYPISVNLSPKRLEDPGFSRRVREILSQTGAPADRLIFEVTEGLWIQDMAATTRSMHDLCAAGIRFSIDDFGTGYSNLAYLKRLPVHELKIDRSLVQEIPDDEDSLAIVEMVLEMGVRLGLRTVAEGVETQIQRDHLFRHGCNAIQGYLKARPMPVKEWISRIGSHHASPD
jgi:EAL domain-containing protein (putative c-di-GMP-specific phosphodiesterase class I)